ncbi:hypothetical protein SD71_15510 [Cohnella kolymensis]|uniref:Uncharacterized protein n=1 Tax=Cohnella kolymensis TaxID=1590652 RepID=A0ABR5A1Z0_9BACL|nr:hypothetical protein [Cohnella kolymensis]KIL35064.1 hypothetical protein SD71_15510 [Cohnella kolymensis]
MEIELLKDLIKDERGNYYTVVHRDGTEITLVNALAERSYAELLEFTDEFKKKYAEYEHQFIGKIAMDVLRHDIVFALKEDGHGRIHPLDAVMQQFRVTFVDMIEFYRNPQAWRGSHKPE